jgi:predicted enzyme related to lactoylglutathione lyase
VPRTAVKGMGWYAVALDPQNNLFGLWQMDESAA